MQVLSSRFSAHSKITAIIWKIIQKNGTGWVSMNDCKVCGRDMETLPFLTPYPSLTLCKVLANFKSYVALSVQIRCNCVSCPLQNLLRASNLTAIYPWPGVGLLFSWDCMCVTRNGCHTTLRYFEVCEKTTLVLFFFLLHLELCQPVLWLNHLLHIYGKKLILFRHLIFMGKKAQIFADLNRCLKLSYKEPKRYCP